MKEIPIIFSGPMVQAIQDGRKTITRRVIKPQPGNAIEKVRFDADYNSWIDEAFDFVKNRKCPYGVPGDRLWVKETHYLWGTWEQYYDGDKQRWRFIDHTDVDHPVRYPAAEGKRFYQGPANGGDDYHCRPSIFMRREYSRIMLDVTDVRVERVRDITEQDAKASGISVLILQSEDDHSAWYQSAPGVHQARNARVSFASRWDSINAKRGYGWSTNPWVWVVEFKVVSVNLAA